MKFNFLKKGEADVQKTLNMCEGSLFKKTILFTVPIMLTGILQLLFNAADLIIVGRFCGSNSVAAVGATSSLINLIVNLFIGLSTGSGVAVARAIGASDEECVKQTVHTAIPTALVSGLVVSVIGFFVSQPILSLTGVPKEILSLSTVYLKIYFCGMLFNMVYNFGASILRAAGDSRSPLVFLTLAGIINVVLNVLFVTIFDWNVAGVAAATSISQVVSAVLVVRALMKRTDACKLNLKDIKFMKRPLYVILSIGIPSGIQSTVFSLSNVIIQSSINSFGNVAMSGSAAAGNIEGFLYIVLNAFHQTSLNFSGQNSGAGKFDRVKKTFFVCSMYVAIIGLACGVGMYLMGEKLLLIYLPNDPKAIEYGMIRFTYILFPYFLCGLMEVATGAIRGMGSSFTTMIISIIGVCAFRVVWIFTIFRIEEFHSLHGLFVSYPISWTVSFLAQLIAFRFVLRKRERIQQKTRE